MARDVVYHRLEFAGDNDDTSLDAEPGTENGQDQHEQHRHDRRPNAFAWLRILLELLLVAAVIGQSLLLFPSRGSMASRKGRNDPRTECTPSSDNFLALFDRHD
jgi:hypothetical protein